MGLAAAESSKRRSRWVGSRRRPLAVMAADAAVRGQWALSGSGHGEVDLQ